MKMFFCLYLLLGSSGYSTSLPLFQSVADLPVDESNRITENLLLFKESEKCNDIYHISRTLDSRAKAHIGGKLLIDFFGNVPADACPAVCIERGTRLDYVTYPFPEQMNFNVTHASSWVQKNCQSKEIGIIYYGTNPANLYWIDRQGDRVLSAIMERGERNTKWLQSFLGHSFELIDQTTNQSLAFYTVEFDSIRVYGDYDSQIDETYDPTPQIKGTFQNEFVRAHNVLRTYTEFGFNKGKIPKPLFASMQAFFYNNNQFRAREEWGPGKKGVFVNWWDQDVHMIQMPPALKRYWQAQLKELVEIWSGATLELTDIYGIRRYNDGARLLTHVDREQTHALSLIINVDQGDIRKQWPVEIYDHQDRLHEISMEPGDIVYYESARSLHGRMQPLEGAYYANIFAHYRPINNLGVADPMWYRQPNPSDTNAVGELESCQLLVPGTTKGVVCKHKGMPITATSLVFPIKKLHGPDDLFEHWKAYRPAESSVTSVTGTSVHSEL